MKGNTGEIHIVSESELYKYNNHHSGTPTKQKQGAKNKVGLGVPEYIGELVEQKQKIRTINHRKSRLEASKPPTYYNRLQPNNRERTKCVRYLN